MCRGAEGGGSGGGGGEGSEDTLSKTLVIKILGWHCML